MIQSLTKMECACTLSSSWQLFLMNVCVHVSVCMFDVIPPPTPQPIQVPYNFQGTWKIFH